MLQLMETKRFHDLMADAKNRIQRRAWFLENVIYQPAADAPQFLLGHLQNITAIEQNLAVAILCWRAWQQTRDRHGGDGFSAAAFAYQTNRFSFLDGKGDTIERSRGLAAAFKLERQITNFQQRHDF
jgi:hypothetical protein